MSHKIDLSIVKSRIGNLHEAYNIMHILVIEDNEPLAQALSLHFKDKGHAVTAVHDGEAGLQFLKQEQFDCCILDINLPSLSGLELLRMARQASIQTPILILTARDDLDDRVKGLDAGADDYLAKPFEMAELDARLRALLRRRPEITAKQSQLGPLILHHEGRFISHDDQKLSLSAKEFAALEALFDYRNQLLPKSSLISHVYGVGAEINDTTIEVLVSRLRKKLKPYAIMIKTARGLGYYLQDQN